MRANPRQHCLVTSEEELALSEKEQPIPARKRRRAIESTVAIHRDPKVVFKLVSYKSGAIRCFPLECTTGKELFDKARNFFRLSVEMLT
jgi:hypothetical protein